MSMHTRSIAKAQKSAPRATGRSTVPELDLPDGQYNLFDQNENLLGSVTVRGQMLLGLASLAEKYDGKDIKLSFFDDAFVCE